MVSAVKFLIVNRSVEGLFESFKKTVFLQVI